MEIKSMLEQEAAELRRILDAADISTVFQPIFSLRDGAVLGHEALSRCRSELFSSPALLFEAARRHGALWDVEYMCRLSALRSFSKQAGEGLLFVNIDPHVVNEERFRRGFTLELMREFHISPAEMVLEVTENHHFEDESTFLKAIETYKEQHYSIAIDDTGSGYSGLNQITRIGPQYIKLDMELIRGVDQSKLKSSLVHALCAFARDCDIRLIAEGIETQEEFAALVELGVHYGQGYYLGRPAKELTQTPPWLPQRIRAATTHTAAHPFLLPAGLIARPEITLDIRDRSERADQLFKAYPELYGIPVTEGSRVRGLLSRSSFYYQLGTKFGYDLFVHRPVSLIMDKSPLIVDYYTDIDLVCAAAMQRPVDKLYNSIVVTRNENYYGMLSVKNILEKVCELKVENAKHLNPLTYLPGNLIIENRLSQMIHSGAQETILYLDVDNFKAYNDKYGTLKGDRFLTFVSDCLLQASAEFGENAGFIGHIGGDDFILIAPNNIAFALAMRIIQIFEEKKSILYCEQALREGGIAARNRSGRLTRFPLATLSIAGVSCSDQTCRSIYQLTETAAVVKKNASASQAIPSSFKMPWAQSFINMMRRKSKERTQGRIGLMRG